VLSPIRIEALLQKAEAAKAKAHDEAEVEKLGVLRGGSSGCVTDAGDVHGTCHRVALLRFLGISEPTGDSSVHYFAAGAANEERWLGLLKSAHAGLVRAEEEIPIRWTVGGRGPDDQPDALPETPVTGRPDIVLCDEAGSPQVVLELKAVCSPNRAVKAFIECRPDMKHLAQLAHYSWKLGMLPGILSYSSMSGYDTPYWAVKKYNCDRKILPGRQHFYTGWIDNQFVFIHPLTGEVVETEITTDGIERFYRLVLAMEKRKALGPRPSDEPGYPDGKDTPHCKYCKFSDVCDQYDSDADYQGWLERAKLISEDGDDD
jgi:hypothetical protein